MNTPNLLAIREVDNELGHVFAIETTDPLSGLPRMPPVSSEHVQAYCRTKEVANLFAATVDLMAACQFYLKQFGTDHEDGPHKLVCEVIQGAVDKARGK